MEKKQRVAIIQKGGITIRLDFKLVTDENFQTELEKHAKISKVDVDSILTYTLGTEDEMENGNLYFCPRCGHYNEYAHEPQTNMFYRKSEGSEEAKPAGYYKMVPIECDNCGETFDVSSRKMDEEAEKLTRSLFPKEEKKEND